MYTYTCMNICIYTYICVSIYRNATTYCVQKHKKQKLRLAANVKDNPKHIKKWKRDHLLLRSFGMLCAACRLICSHVFAFSASDLCKSTRLPYLYFSTYMVV